MTDKFVEIIMKEINKHCNCYYEEAPNDTTFPYVVMTTLTLNPLDSGYNGIFDLEIYINELSTESVENLIDTLRDNLDGFFYRDKNLAFHVGFDSQLIVKSNEQDLSMRRITFQARLFR